ncbi:hypothetical protein PC9H_010278 [Pleurotus ostreatus]|uniref:HAT C-terminal dimerisation domain-containing protein n=1 Tax=Pleurotus ostreatus TaxID=5322 RepID=A0A8H6ZQN8_PLEOS|nr:uncharacterized protein PC9H_010278 [Pleurotus ostreatus]KAF7424967.1 hypothetical protein PC9H_010278 [Pleurotus ostreatus]
MKFTSWYQVKERDNLDQFVEFLKLPQENFDTCDPIKWWAGRESLFPDLFRLARDIFTIPGSAVAVEHIFSGGRDTISIRRASLKPDTIRTLMIVKQRLKLAREAVKELLGNA